LTCKRSLFTHHRHSSTKSSRTLHPNGTPTTRQKKPIMCQNTPLACQKCLPKFRVPHHHCHSSTKSSRISHPNGTPMTCQKRSIMCQKRPITCQKRRITCQKRPLKYKELMHFASKRHNTLIQIAQHISPRSLRT